MTPAPEPLPPPHLDGASRRIVGANSGVERWANIVALAATQYGLASVDQLDRLGVPQRWRRSQVEAGRLSAYRRGVLLVNGHPASALQPLMAAVLAANGSAYISHTTAAWLRGYERVLPEPVQLTVFFRHATELAGVITHESWVHHPSDLTIVRGIPVTSPARTVVDCAGSFSEYLLARLIDHLRRTNQLELRDLRITFDRLAGRGRRGTPLLRTLILEREEGLEAGDSDLEVDILRPVLAAGLPAPEQNAHVELDGGIKLTVDYLWRRWKVVVEVKGYGPHRERTAFDYGAERKMLLEAAKYHVIEVTSRTSIPLLIRSLKQLLSGEGAE